MNKENVAPKKKRRKKKKKPMSKGLTVFLTVFLIFFMVGVVTCGWIAIDVFTDIGLINVGKHDIKNDVAGVDYIDLDAYIANQSKTTIIYAYDSDNKEVELARLHGAENREWVDLENVCKDLQNAVVALEDKRFPKHHGVDWIRTIGVIVEYNFSQGGSTITQQLIKNLTGENNRTFVRKYKEIKNALKLEQHYDKNQILEAYLNTIYLDMGCYGVKTAAEYYFDKDVDELTLMESAILASITNAPRKYNPIINYDNNRERATECLDKMKECGYINQAEYDAALAEDVKFIGDTGPRKDDEEDTDPALVETEYNSYYVDYIIDSLIRDFRRQYGDTEAEAWRRVFYGGLRVYAAVDTRIQGIMDEVYENREGFPKEEDTPENPAIQSAMVIMDYEGRVVGTVGRFGKKTGNRTLNIGTSSPRQPGSSIKPLSAYAPAIDTGYFYWSSYIPNYGIELNDGTIWPTNFGGVTGDPNDLKNLPQAIAPSLNTVPARIVQTLGLDTSFSYLRDRFHLTTLDDPKDRSYSPLATGGLTNGATVLEMTNAFTTFGNGGLYYEPWCYYKVTNAAGTEILLQPDRVGEQVIKRGTADVMNHLLQCVVSYPNGTGHRFPVNGFTTFSKSGTSSSNNDKWIIGGSPYYVCGVWTGYEIPKSIPIWKYPGNGNPAGALYKTVMDRVHEGLEPKEFTFSDDCVRRSYCTRTGLLAGRYCPTAVGWYTVDSLPSVCTVCGGGGAPVDPEDPPDIPEF